MCVVSKIQTSKRSIIVAAVAVAILYIRLYWIQHNQTPPSWNKELCFDRPFHRWGQSCCCCWWRQRWWWWCWCCVNSLNIHTIHTYRYKLGFFCLAIILEWMPKWTFGLAQLMLVLLLLLDEKNKKIYNMIKTIYIILNYIICILFR